MTALPSPLPYTITTIIARPPLGRPRPRRCPCLRRSPRRSLSYQHRASGRQEETRGCNARWDAESGRLVYEVDLEFAVNGTPGGEWRSLTGSWTLIPWGSTAGNGKAQLLHSTEDVYCNGLKECVERMYDTAIVKHSGSFIPLG